MSTFEKLGEQWAAQQAQVASMQSQVGEAVETIESMEERLCRLERQMNTVIESLQAVHVAIAPLFSSLAQSQFQQAERLALQAHKRVRQRRSVRASTVVPATPTGVVVPATSDEEEMNQA